MKEIEIQLSRKTFYQLKELAERLDLIYYETYEDFLKQNKPIKARFG